MALNEEWQTSLEITTFIAKLNNEQNVDEMGLPLKPNSIYIIGNLHRIRSLYHPNLLRCIEFERRTNERMIVISETSLRPLLKESFIRNQERIPVISSEIFSALKYLRLNGITHRNISPKNIYLDENDLPRLADYWLFHVTDNGSRVSFPIGHPIYLPPEIILAGNSEGCSVSAHSIYADLWSFGILLLDWMIEFRLFKKFELDIRFSLTFLTKIIRDVSRGDSFVERLLREFPGAKEAFNQQSPDFREFINNLLQFCPKDRLTFDQTANHVFLNSVQHKSYKKENELFLLRHEAINSSLQLPSKEIYFLWKLLGGNPHELLKTHKLAQVLPHILTMNRFYYDGKWIEESRLEPDFHLNMHVPICLDRIKKNYFNIPLTIRKPMIFNKIEFPQSLHKYTQLKIKDREAIFEYQVYRMALFRRLLEGYPFTKDLITSQASIDIPPTYRSYVWACLLGVQPSFMMEFEIIDKITPDENDHQLNLDIRRCHSYDATISSPYAQKILKGILKAWIRTHDSYEYWQGLDSVAAPFIFLNVTNDALAYACFIRFVSTFCPNLFLRNDPTCMDEHLAHFQHLIGFHDPELLNHLVGVGCEPNHFALRWFITSFSHILTIDKTCHLWDHFLCSSPLMIMCYGIAILTILRTKILSSSQNDCILLVNNIPSFSVDDLIDLANAVFRKTPPSIIFNPRKLKSSKSPIDYEFDQYPDRIKYDRSQVLNEKCPRISCRDMLKYIKFKVKLKRFSKSVKEPYIPNYNSHNTTLKFGLKIQLIDIRSEESFCTGHLKSSISIPYYPQEFKSFEELLLSKINPSIKGPIIIVSNDPVLAVKFGETLIRRCFSYVCALDYSVSLLSQYSLLV